MKFGMPRAFFLVALTCAAPGCLSPVVIDLPQTPSAEVLQAAVEHRREVSGSVRFEVVDAVRALTLERHYGDAFHRYTLPIGASLESTLRRLCRAAIKGPRRRERRGEPLRLRVVAAESDCVLDREVSVTVQVTLEASLGTQLLDRGTFRGAGAASLEGVWSFGLPARLEDAFGLALLKLHAQVIRFLAGLELPPPSALALAEPALALAPASQRDAPASAAGSARGLQPTTVTWRDPAGGVDLSAVDARLAIGDLEGALEGATALIAAHPNSASAFQRRGAVRLSLGQLDGAMADCFRALELDSTLANAYVTRAHVYARRGDHRRARADCEAALRQSSGSAVEDAARALLEGLDRG